MMEYKPRFIEDFVLNELVGYPDQSDQDIALKFVNLHARVFEEYICSLENIIRKEYISDIGHLNNKRRMDWLKSKFIEAMGHYGLISDDSRSEVIRNKIRGVSIKFDYGGRGGTTDGHKLLFSLFLVYKIQNDSNDGERFPSKNLIYGIIFHELGHILGGEFCGGVPDPIAQGISRLAMQYLGLEDALTCYYKKKEKEIQKLGKEKRIRSASTARMIRDSVNEFPNVYARSRMMYLNYGIGTGKSIEVYANPLSLKETKKILL